MTIATANALNSLRYGKLSLRREIQNEINFYGQKNSKPRKSEIEQLLQGIEKLNAEIEKLEGLVNRRVEFFEPPFNIIDDLLRGQLVD